MDQHRTVLKLGCLARLEAVAQEHPAGHQGKLAARYVMRSKSGDRIGMMFEKHSTTGAYLWMEHRFARTLFDLGIAWRSYPAYELYRSDEPDAKPRYGRHAALKAMRDLANADLVRFEIGTVDQMDLLLMGIMRAEG